MFGRRFFLRKKYFSFEAAGATGGGLRRSEPPQARVVAGAGVPSDERVIPFCAADRKTPAE